MLHYAQQKPENRYYHFLYSCKDIWSLDFLFVCFFEIPVQRLHLSIPQNIPLVKVHVNKDWLIETEWNENSESGCTPATRTTSDLMYLCGYAPSSASLALALIFFNGKLLKEKNKYTIICSLNSTFTHLISSRHFTACSTVHFHLKVNRQR